MRFGIFQVEMALCCHAMSRLLRSPGKGFPDEDLDEPVAEE